MARLKIVYQRFDLLPVDERPGAANGGQAFADLPRHFGRTRGASQFEPQPSLRRCVSSGDLDQQIREASRAECFEVLHI